MQVCLFVWLCLYVCAYTVCVFQVCLATACVFHRSNHECDPGSVLRCVHLDLCCCGHHLHPAGRSLLCGLHRHHTAHSHFHHFGNLVAQFVWIISYKDPLACQIISGCPLKPLLQHSKDIPISASGTCQIMTFWLGSFWVQKCCLLHFPWCNSIESFIIPPLAF